MREWSREALVDAILRDFGLRLLLPPAARRQLTDVLVCALVSPTEEEANDLLERLERCDPFARIISSRTLPKPKRTRRPSVKPSLERLARWLVESALEAVRRGPPLPIGPRPLVAYVRELLSRSDGAWLGALIERLGRVFDDLEHVLLEGLKPVRSRGGSVEWEAEIAYARETAEEWFAVLRGPRNAPMHHLLVALVGHRPELTKSLSTFRSAASVMADARLPQAAGDVREIAVRCLRGEPLWDASVAPLVRAGQTGLAKALGTWLLLTEVSEPLTLSDVLNAWVPVREARATERWPMRPVQSVARAHGHSQDRHQPDGVWIDHLRMPAHGDTRAAAIRQLRDRPLVRCAAGITAALAMTRTNWARQHLPSMELFDAFHHQVVSALPEDDPRLAWLARKPVTAKLYQVVVKAACTVDRPTAPGAMADAVWAAVEAQARWIGFDGHLALLEGPVRQFASEHDLGAIQQREVRSYSPIDGGAGFK